MRSVCFAAVVFLSICASLALRAGEGDFGRYSVGRLGTSSLAPSAQVAGTETPEIYRTQATQPVYYQAEVPDGEYRVVIHYLEAEKEKGFSFTVVSGGREVVGRTACFVRMKKDPKKAVAAQVEFTAKAVNKRVKIRFPRKHKEKRGWADRYAICALEILGDLFELRINCGADQDVTDRAGKVWKADRPFPMPEATISLKPDDRTNEWINISTEMLNKLVAAGVEPLTKYRGFFTGFSNGMFYDRSGTVYINFAGIGLWVYEGPGGSLRRAGGERYTSVCKGESINPYGPGFVLVCSHGFNDKKAYQALSWDGTTIETWPLDGDIVAVDWSAPGKIKPILSKPRHNNILILSKDAGANSKQVAKRDHICNIGTLGDGVLIYCIGTRKGAPDDGIYRSPDEGKTWEQVSDISVWADSNCSSIVACKERAYLHSPKGLLKSTDRGKNWRIVPDSPAFTYALQLAEDDSHMLGLSREGVYESTDQGETWQKITEAPPEGKKWIQSHQYYDFAWDYKNDVIYASAPNHAYRYARRQQP